MSFLVVQLTRLTGYTVLDKTGLKGSYDFAVNWTPDDKKQMLKAAWGRGGRAGGTTADSSGPSVLTALEEQLGLKLRATKGAMEVLLVDHAERAREN